MPSGGEEAFTPADQLLYGAVRSGVAAATLICLSTLLLGCLGLLSRPFILGVTLGLIGLGLWVGRSAPRLIFGSPAFWPVLFSVPLVVLQTLVVLPLPPVDWDAVTYHVFLPAKWLEAKALVHVPMVFGDESTAFAPQNGALIFAWWMGLVKGDAGVPALQVGALFLLATALWLLARALGASPLSAGLAVAALPWIAPVQRWTYSGNVDIFMTAFWIAAAALLLASRRRSDFFLGGLALGLAVGTKTVALPLGAGLTLAAVPGLVRADRNSRLLFCLGTLLTGSFWWLRNLYYHGNPLFPLDVTVGSWRLFPGVFGSEAMRASVFTIDSFGTWLRTLKIAWGGATCILVLLGWGLLAFSAARAENRERRLLHGTLLLLAVGWAYFVWKVVPFNNQVRFLLPALVLAVPGWAVLLDRIPHPKARLLACALGVGLLATVSRPDRFLLQRLEWLTSPHGARVAALAHADYPLWRDAYTQFNRPVAPPKRIAYSGANIPYTLVGPGLRNHVVYCNVQGQPTDGLWEFWQRKGEPRFDYYMPGLYRGREEADTWLACLEKERIDTVVLFWVIPIQAPTAWQLDDGFPVERRFMRERPERFRRVLQTDRSEIWEVRPWGEP